MSISRKAREKTNELFAYTLGYYTYMFGVVDECTTTQHCFLYGEENKTKGADNVISIVYYYVCEFASTSVQNCKHLVIFVDNCSGENNNLIVCAFLRVLVSTDAFLFYRKLLW